MANETLRFDITGDSSSASRAFRSAADSAALAARGAKQLADTLGIQTKSAQVASGATLALAKSDKILRDAELELAGAADETRHQLNEQGRAAEETAVKTRLAGDAARGAGGGFGLLASPMGAAIGAAAALAPVLVTVGLGLGGLGLAAYGAIAPIEKAAKKTGGLSANLQTLGPEQQAVALGILALGKQYDQFQKQLQPEVLTVFGGGLKIARDLLRDIEPVTAATGKALGTVLGRIDTEFQSGTWQKFFQFMAKSAGPDIQLLGTLFIDLTNDLPPLLEMLQPVATGLLKITDAVANLPGALDRIKQKTGANTPGVTGGTGLDRIRQFISWGEKHIPAGNKSISDLIGLTNKTQAAAAAAGVPLSDLAVQLSTGQRAAKLASTATAALSANQYVLAASAAAATGAQDKLNTAWSSFLAQSTDLETAQLGVRDTLDQVTKQAAVAGVTFTGTNQASRALQETFESGLVPGVQNVINGMRKAHASAGDLAEVVRADLKPAIDAGALSNKALRQQIYDMAVEAGYHGPDNIKKLTAWFDRGRSSAEKAQAKIDALAASIAALPSGKSIGVTVRLSAAGGINAVITAPGQASVQGGGRLTLGGLAAGGKVTGGTPGRDSVVAALMPGEVVVPTGMVRAGAVDHLRGKLPGFAAGGLAGAPGWAAGRGAAFEASAGEAFAKSVLAAFRKSFTSPALGGNVTSWLLAAMADTSAPASWLPALLQLVARESGGNPRAVNPVAVYGEHASGLFQTLPSTYAQFATVPGGVFNPVSDAVAGIRYIRALYGSPFNIPNLFSGPYQGYDRGGLLRPGLTLAYNGTGRAEQVIPAGSGTGDVHLHLHNNGVIGSKAELERWFLDVANKTAREGKLGYALRRSASAA